MPKTAAAVLGFALVTGSIGFNTVRYPVVWKMVGAADPSKPTTESPPASPAPQSITPQPAGSESPAPAAMPVLEPATNPSPATTSDEPNDEAHPEAKQEAAAPAESKPSETPSSADKAATASAEDANAPQPAAPLDSEDDQGSAAETPRKPLVPVLPVSIPKESLGGNGAKPGVVHLPAVEPQGQGTDRDDAQRLTSGTLPQYRATGTP